MASQPSGQGRIIGLGLFVVALASILAIVLERIGVPVGLLASLAAGLATFCVAAAGLSGGSMRFPDFVHGGRVFSGSALSLILAMACAPVFGFGFGLACAIGLVLLALAGAAGLHASGASGWGDYVRIRFGPGLLAKTVSPIVGIASLALAAGAAGRLVELVAAAADLPREPAAAVAALLLVVVAVPGGVQGAARAALMAGIVGLACGAILAALSLRTGTLHGPGFAAILTDAGWMLPAALAALAPSAALLVGTAREPGAARRGLLGAALLAMVFDLVSPTQGAGLAGAAAPAVVAFAGIFGATSGLSVAAGLAFGRDLPGEPGRHSALSARFARLRLACLLSALLAVWAGAFHPELVRTASGPATSALLAVVLPVCFTGLLMTRAGKVAGWAAAAAGAVVAAAAATPVLGFPGGPDAAGLWGAFGGLAAGVALALVRPRETPVAQTSGRAA